MNLPDVLADLPSWLEAVARRSLEIGDPVLVGLMVAAGLARPVDSPPPASQISDKPIDNSVDTS